MISISKYLLVSDDAGNFTYEAMKSTSVLYVGP